MKIVPLKRARTPEDVTASVKNVIDNNYPMLMVAKRPDGAWEISMFIPSGIGSHEVIGALWQAQHRLLYQGDMCGPYEDDPETKRE